uniref:separase n=1 Tax=Stomoxys calcitrans TaxID=35570 RepID=A0A1I8NXC8_STOCA
MAYYIGQFHKQCIYISPEALLHHAEEEYLNGNMPQSIFYQVVSLYQTFQDHYYRGGGKRKSVDVKELMNEMSAEEKSELKKNCLIQYVGKSLNQMAKNKPKNKCEESTPKPEGNFLKGITNPIEGIHKLEEVCKQMPKVWTILQLCKGPRTETTFSIYPNIHESDAAIYLTIIKHARSDRYPMPICLRFCGSKQKELFESFANIINRFKHSIKVDPKDYYSIEARKLYWKSLSEVNDFMTIACEELKRFFFPWNFLFAGISHSFTTNDAFAQRWTAIDKFCDSYELDNQCRILLSLAALRIGELTVLEIEGICTILFDNAERRELAVQLLKEMQQQQQDDASEHYNKDDCYPCILVIDEYLDHFFWEEMNVHQEFTRVNSLQCLWRLYQAYKKDIHNGYLQVNITNGGSIINPDQSLCKMEVRMRSFMEHWLPHWKLLCSQRPTQEELRNNFFNRSCYVYAGHGSGLQYINGRNIAKLQMQCVVFLFGCDSSRLYSNGLYSELWGPHMYYHAAMCPALVGTLMPCLDSFMDGVATEILSRWIAPKSPNILPWNEIEPSAWIKGGIIKSKTLGCEGAAAAASNSAAFTTTSATMSDYHLGSLCGVLARIRQRITETKLYNTAPYVCRGLPVWNCHVQPPPT